MLNKLETEVKELNDKIISLCAKDTELNKLYKGCQIYFTPIRIKPDIMILGINPGAGYFRINNQPVQMFGAPAENEKSDYMEEIYALFRKINNPGLRDKSFISNIYYFSTNGGKELYSLKKLLPEDIRNEFKEKAKEWTKCLIAEIDPPLIFCMGVEAWGYLKDFYKEDFEIVTEKGFVLEAKIGQKPVIGCVRSYSFIQEIELVAEKLKEYCGKA
jgi:hypothetical protein